MIFKELIVKLSMELENFQSDLQHDTNILGDIAEKDHLLIGVSKYGTYAVPGYYSAAKGTDKELWEEKKILFGVARPIDYIIATYDMFNCYTRNGVVSWYIVQRNKDIYRSLVLEISAKTAENWMADQRARAERRKSEIIASHRFFQHSR